jgi:hypothetical protein
MPKFYYGRITCDSTDVLEIHFPVKTQLYRFPVLSRVVLVLIRYSFSCSVQVSFCHLVAEHTDYVVSFSSSCNYLKQSYCFN